MVTASAEIELGRVVVGKLDGNHWPQPCREWTHTWVHKGPFRGLDRNSHDMVALGTRSSRPHSSSLVVLCDSERGRHDANHQSDHIGSVCDCCNGHGGRTNQEFGHGDEKVMVMASLW